VLAGGSVAVAAIGAIGLVAVTGSDDATRLLDGSSSIQQVGQYADGAMVSSSTSLLDNLTGLTATSNLQELASPTSSTSLDTAQSSDSAGAGGTDSGSGSGDEDADQGHGQGARQAEENSGAGTEADPAGATVAPGGATGEAEPRSGGASLDAEASAARQQLAVEPSFPAVYTSTADDATPIASLVATDRYLLTSAWALGNETQVMLRIDGQWRRATVAAVDHESDVAVLTPEADLSELGLPPFVPVSADVGTSVLAGYCPDLANWLSCQRSWPLITDLVTGEDDERSPAASIISRVAAAPMHSGYVGFDQLKAEILASPQRYGGPLLNQSGQVVGMVVAAANVNLMALPIDRAVRIADSMMAEDYVSPWIGVEVQDRDNGRGVRIKQVDDLSPAALVLIKGDIILSVNDYLVTSSAHLTDLIERTEPGDTITVQRRRGVRDPVGNNPVLATVELQVEAPPALG
jgi:S1-C subfamily serine protease